MRDPAFDHHLVSYLGADAADGLRRWRDAMGLEPRVPTVTWRATNGFTDAQLAALLVTRGDDRAWKIVLKVCPPRTPEPAAHADAWADAPAFARDHLVEMPFPPWPTPAGRILLFQAIAGNDDRFTIRPLSALPEPGRTEAAALVAEQLLICWNEGRAGSVRRAVPSFLRDEVGPVVETWGSIRRWARGTALLDSTSPWLLVDGDEEPVPNPVLAVAGRGPLAKHEIDVLVGRAHRDLHLENALVPFIDTEHPEPAAFRLVDLATYAPSASLTVDPVMLVLSLAARELSTWDEDERARRLSAHAAVPDSGTPADGVVAAVLRTVSIHHGSHRRDWSHQWVLSVLARALLFTTFERLAPDERWWFFRLACRAAANVLHERDPEAGPDRAVTVHNPFPAMRSWTSTRDDGRPPLALGPGGVLGYDRG